MDSTNALFMEANTRSRESKYIYQALLFHYSNGKQMNRTLKANEEERHMTTKRDSKKSLDEI